MYVFMHVHMYVLLVCIYLVHYIYFAVLCHFAHLVTPEFPTAG